jgi:hypothetical protein
MFQSRYFSLFVGFSLLTVPLILANQADAQTIQLTSLKTPDCVSGGSANLPDCTSGARGSDLQKGTLLSLVQNGTLLRESVANSSGADHRVNNQGSVEGVGIGLVSDINTGLVTSTSSSGANFQELEGGTLNLGLTSDRHTVRSDLNQSLNNSNWSGSVVSLIDSPTAQTMIDLPTAQTIAFNSSGQFVVSMINLPTAETIIDSPTAETIIDSPTAETIIDSSTVETIASDSSGQSDALSRFGFSSTEQPAPVPEPSLSLLGWLGLGAAGLFSKRFRSKQ